ncbi:MAG: IS66 family transposase [Thermoanaerobaculaceae bacterium]|jgi:transposase|nr:IS66 family transposase [Thermoanaerobaculaceae bacterium]
MPNLAAIHDPETLRQIATLLEKTVLTQQRAIAELKAEVSRLRGETGPTQLELDLLKEQLERLKKKVFAPSSEKRPQPAEAATPARRTGHGPRPQPLLPVVTVTHTLPEQRRICPVCSGQLVPWGEQAEVSDEVTVLEVSYEVVTHRRQKYRCSCNAAVVTAPGPVKLIPGGHYSVEFAVHVAEAKYLDHMPLERQVRSMGRRGLEVDSQTLYDQLKALSEHLEPTYEALCRKVLSSEIVFTDETHWRQMEDGSKRWWAWCVATDDAAAYWIREQRSREAAEGVLGGYAGVLMSDGYAVYASLARGSPEIVPVHCWAHVRRKFVEAEVSFPTECGRALELIGALYEVERAIPRLPRGAPEEARLDVVALRRRLRQERSRPIVDELREWAYATRPAVLPQSSVGKAIDYMLSLWPGLTRFLVDPRVPLDNNAAERALRGLVVGRKNHYGSHSKQGARVAAILYTLFESAKLAGVDPRAYVLEAARRAIATPGTVTLPAHLT